MATLRAIQRLHLSDPYAELPVKNHKYVKNCTELYMANKHIAKIVNFEAFINLEVLWINGNQLQELDGLENCFRLKQLYAQENCIRSLDGSSLPHLKFLQELRLHDNKLNDLQVTLKVLSRLSNLRDLDLFGNAIEEEKNYRLQVIRAIPSLNVLDRHVITLEERTRALSLQLEDGAALNEKKCKKELSGSTSQALSGTVRMLFREVEAIKREQQKALEKLQQESLELKLVQNSVNPRTPFFKRAVNHDDSDKITGLDHYEVSALKKYFESYEVVKNGGVEYPKLEHVFLYLRTRGYAVFINGHRSEGRVSDRPHLESVLPATGTIQWNSFVQLFVLKQLHCEMLSPHKLRQMAEICFDKCAVLQRHLQFCGTNEASSAQLMKEMLTLSQQGYRLQALTDGDQSSNIPKSSRVLNADVCGTTSSLSNGTRFIITIPFREKVSTCPLMAVRRG